MRALEFDGLLLALLGLRSFPFGDAASGSFGGIAGLLLGVGVLVALLLALLGLSAFGALSAVGVIRLGGLAFSALLLAFFAAFLCGLRRFAVLLRIAAFAGLAGFAVAGVRGLLVACLVVGVLVGGVELLGVGHLFPSGLVVLRRA